jgi:cobalt-zinc-cadmium efflux system membrane fusion protein
MHKTLPVVTIAMLLSCGPHGPDHQLNEISPGGHEEMMMQSTLFTDSLEFFTEYPVLVTGEEATILVHVTRLNNYKALQTGRAEIELGGIKETSGDQDVPGIYRITMKPGNAGKYIMKLTFHEGNRTSQVSDSVIVFENDEQAHKHFTESINPAVIHFTKEQAWNSNFIVRQVIPGPFAAVIPASGEILAMPGEKQNVSATSSGIVLFAARNLVQGSRVTKGQLLFTIAGQDLTGNNVGVVISEVYNRYLQSKSEYERHHRLFSENLLAERQFIETQTRYKTDSSAWHALSRNAVSGGMKVVAPLSGYLHELNVSEGLFIEAGTLLATISTNEILLLRADVSQQYYPLLNRIETARFRPAYTEKSYSVSDLKGHLLAKGASVAENNHYMPVYFEVKNDGSLLEGAFAEFWLITRETRNCIALPLGALIEEQGSYFVYRQVSGETYIKQAVTTGSGDGESIEITSGLQSGDRIVTVGAMQLKVASISSAMPGEQHQH